MYKISGFSDEIDTNIDVQFAVLDKLGIKFFEPRGVNGKNISDLTEDEAKELKRKMDEHKIKASSIGSPIGKINIEDEFLPHLKKLEHCIKIAKILDCRYIRIFSFFITDKKYEAHRDEVMRRMKEMIKLAEREGVILLHENEKGIYGDLPERCKDIFDTVGNKNLGCVFDPANFVQCGAQTYPDAYGLLKDNITYMHIKDALKKDGSVVPAGYGDGCVKEILTKLKENGYDGFYSLEPHLGSFEGLANLELGDAMTRLPKSGEGTFTVAYESLKKILEAN